MTVSWPKVTDREKDKPAAFYEITYPNSYLCNCIKVDMDFSKSLPVSMTIERSKIRIPDMGNYKLVIYIRDDQYM